MQVVTTEAYALAQNQTRLLVVEDEVLIRMYVCDVLREAGYDVIEAADGDQAVDVLKAGIAVDLVLSDVRMPGLTDGLALLAFVRQNLAGLPVILASGHLPPEIAFEEGAAQFLAKPFKDVDALRAVELALVRKR
jgi:CheY-like chemotaxis protein